jgi:predicted AlkP superfamily phosphohydrolase/phosphomutase
MFKEVFHKGMTGYIAAFMKNHVLPGISEELLKKKIIGEKETDQLIKEIESNLSKQEAESKEEREQLLVFIRKLIKDFREDSFAKSE